MLLQAATESPFLENKVSTSTAMLCVLLLPRCLMDLGAMGWYVPGLTDHQREYALRSAIQVGRQPGLTQRLAAMRGSCLDALLAPRCVEFRFSFGVAKLRTMAMLKQLHSSVGVNAGAVYACCRWLR